MTEVVLYIARESLETLVRAAAAYMDYYCKDEDVIEAIDIAIDNVQSGLIDDMHEPVDTDPLCV